MAYAFGSVNIRNDLKNIPDRGILKDGSHVILDYYNEQRDYEQIKDIYFQALKDGISYPYKSQTEQEFINYYINNQLFVLRYDLNTHKQYIEGKNDLIGCFYIKPNFPGNCSHICNGGFLVKNSESGKGACRFMAERYLVLAKQLGYRGSHFNLVFECNPASIHLWRKLNFQETGKVPKVFKMENGEYCDAIQFHYDLTQDNIPSPIVNLQEELAIKQQQKQNQ